MNDIKRFPAKHSPVSRIGYYNWSWVTILASVLIGAMVFGLNLRQNQLLTQATDVMTSMHLARIELTKGFLYVSLSFSPDAPYSREEGLALLQQASVSLEEVSANLNLVLTSEDALRFRQSLNNFQTHLATYREASSLTPALETELRIAFHDLEDQANAVDEKAHRQLDSLQRRFALQFLIVLGVAFILLSAISVASVQMERARAQAEQGLQESEARYRLIADNIADVIWVMDPIVERFTYVSPSVEKLRGYTPEEVMAQPISDSFTPASFKVVSEGLAHNLPAFIARGCGTESYIAEMEQPRKDGSIMKTEVTTTYVFNSSGQVEIIGVSRDITERKQAENDLRRRETLLREMGRIAQIGGWELDVATMKQEWTDETYIIHDRERDSYDPNSTEEISRFEPGSHEQIAKAFDAALTDGKPYDLELEMTTVNGNKKWVRAVCSPLWADGKVVKLTGTVQDITARKQAEESVRIALAKYKTLFEAFPLGITVADADGNILETNHMAEELLGISEAEQKQREIDGVEWRIIRPDGTPMPAEEFPSVRALKEGRKVENVEMGIFKSDEIVTWINVTAAPLPLEGYGVVVTYSDITERKQIEQKKQESERNYRELVQHANSAILRIKRDGSITFFNEFAQTFFGYQPEEIIGKSVNILLPETDSTGVSLSALVQNVVDNPDEFINVINENICRDGRRVWMAWNNKPIYDEHGQVNEILTIGMDITARKEMEEKLRESEARFRLALNSSPIVVFNQDKDLRYSWIYNPQLGFDSQSILGRTDAELVSTDDAARLTTIKRRTLETGIGAREEVKLTTSGQVFYYDLIVEPLHDVHGSITGVTCVTVDITARKLMEEDLRRSNAELEQFAYVASHDLQEPLRTVAGMVQLLQQRYKGQLDERADEYIHFAVDASDRMQKLINDLLEFSRVDRRGKPFASIDMEKVFRNALANLHTAITESGASITHDPLPAVVADAGQLTQVLQNLIGNAIKFRSEKPPEVHVSAVRNKDGWQFAVRDNGIGIDPQYFERVFLIFQRLHTRSKYPGTGIGLALCKKVIERHGGVMWIESEPNHGAVFYFTIPER